MFEITIIEKKTERQLVRGKYQVVDQRPFTEEELSNAIYWQKTEAGQKGSLKDIFGYPPDREEDVVIEREVLKQTVETLDLPAVIKAVNNLS